MDSMQWTVVASGVKKLCSYLGMEIIAIAPSLFPNTSPFAEELGIGNLEPQFWKCPSQMD